MREKKRIDVVSEGALEAIEMKRKQQKLEELDREKREKLIAETYRMMGRIESARMFEKLGTVSSLVWLKQVKESQIYKDILGMGSWESFCNHLGISRAKADIDIQNLNTFGEDFLLTVSSFKVGYRDLRKLRKSIADGEIIIDSESIEIDGEKIPFDPDHKEDLQAAIERIVDEKEEKIQELKKLEKNKDKIIEEETKALKTERDALIKENQRLKVFDPEAQGDKDITWCEEQMKEIYKACANFTVACQKFIIDDRLKEDMHNQAKVEGIMAEAEMMLADLRRRWTDYFIPDDEMM